MAKTRQTIRKLPVKGRAPVKEPHRRAMKKPVLPLNSSKVECGTCKQALAEKATEGDNSFHQICSCCNNQRFLHPKCAKRHFYSVTLQMSQANVTKPSTTLVKNTITPKQFDTCLIPYYCKHCCEKNALYVV